MIPNNLPVVPTPFVGRTKDTQAIQGLLADPTCRLLTLIGPGGIGKTRLSLHILQSIADTDNPDYADGVYFVPLQSLDAPNLIIRAIAKELDFSFFPGDPQQQLLDYLCDKRLLLLLDNLEHLLEGAEVISAILSHAAGVRVLATSREALNLQEEWLYSVSGMGIPEANELDSFESFCAVRVFI
jgi:predicted ATPase